MKTITLVAWRRPNYLRQVIEGLQKNNTSGYSLIGYLDDGCREECWDLLNEVSFMPKLVVMAEKHWGAHHANRQAYELAIKLGSSMNFALEEDTVPSPDCLDLVNWWERRKNGGVLNAFSFSRGPESDPQSVWAGVAGRKHRFNAWGWAADRDTLHSILKSWCEHDPGWDISLQKHLAKTREFVFHPDLSRIKNIGREAGAHYTPELFDRHFGGVVASDSSVCHSSKFILQ